MRFPVPALVRCAVRRVHDGDTINVTTDDARDRYSRMSIRLKDVFAPELRQAGGSECRVHAATWVAQHGDGTEWPFLLETFRTPRSDTEVTTLSRYVGVLHDARGSTLNAEMIDFVAKGGFVHGSGTP